MKLEVIKSYILAILVGISLILSFSLWNYQPKDDSSDEDELLAEEQIDLGGDIESRKTLVQPTQIIFDAYNEYYGFTNPISMHSLNEDLTSWVLYNFRISQANGRPNEPFQVEVIYPTELPMAIIPSLFTINNLENANANLPENMSFQRMYITFESSDHSLVFNFLSTDGKTLVKAEVNNAQKYEMLENYINTSGNIEEYTVLQEEKFPLYLPVKPVQASGYRFNVSDQNDSALDWEVVKNALFRDPQSVFENVTEDMEIWFYDAHRMMQVSKNRLNMEFLFPQEETYNIDAMTSLELLDTSIAKINGYKGWVQDYRLETLTTVPHYIRYQMYYRGYPVFNHNGLATIEQLWVNNELEQHRQPLYTINSPYSESYELTSGENVIEHLKSHDYDLDKIEAVQVGYRLGIVEVEEEDDVITLLLTPSWYIKVNGQWERIILDEELPTKGVN